MNSLDKDCYRRRRKCRPHGSQIIVRHVGESRRHRLKALFHFVLTSGGNSRQRPAMKRVEGGDDFKAAFVVPEFARQFEQALVGFAAAIAEKTFARANQIDQHLRQPALRLVVIKIRQVDELARLLQQRLGDCRMCVAKAVDRDAAAQIQVSPARQVVEKTAGAVAQHEVESAIAGHDVLLKELLDRRSVVAHNWWR